MKVTHQPASFSAVTSSGDLRASAGGRGRWVGTVQASGHVLEASVAAVSQGHGPPVS